MELKTFQEYSKNILFISKNNSEKWTFQQTIEFLEKKKENKINIELFWIDFEGLNENEIYKIGEMSEIDPFIMEACCKEEYLEHIKKTGKCIFLSIKEYSILFGKIRINVVVFPSFVISFHHQPVKSISFIISYFEFHDNFSTEMIIFLLLDRIFRLYEESFYQLKMEAYNINDLIIILSNNEFNELSTRIASANRLTIELQNGLGCIISNLLRNTFLSKDIKKRLKNLFYMAKKFKNRIKLIKNFFRIVHLIHIAKVSLNNLKSSRELELIIRKLTAINVMFLLPVHTHGTFGMNVRDPGMIGMPDTPSGYQWFIGIMCFVGAYFLFCIIMFYKLKWL